MRLKVRGAAKHRRIGKRTATLFIAEPKVFVRAVFQNTKHPDFAGSVRFVPDLEGVACIDLFVQLAKLDGYEPVQLSDSQINDVPNGKLVVGSFFDKKNNRVLGTKILCVEKSALQLIVAAHNQDRFSAPVNAMVLASDLSLSFDK